QIKNRNHRAESKHANIFTQEEQGELHTAVFRMETGNQFVFSFRQIERRTSRLCYCRYQKNQETNWLQYKEPHIALSQHDIIQPEAAYKHYDSNKAQAHAQFIADHLGGSAQATDHRILTVRSPSCQHDTIHA